MTTARTGTRRLRHTKTALYQPLRDRTLAAPPNGWSVEIINVTLLIRGSFARDAVDGGTDGTRGPGDESDTL
jgi:hypothetical protein